MKLIRANTERGFSLVEVTLAVAIAAVAIITFLGLLPMGLETSRKTSTKIANANMLEQVVQNLDGMSWGDNNSNLPKPKETKRMYFNEEGAQVPSTSTDMTYLVEVQFAGPAYLDNDSGSAGNSSGSQDFLQRALIRIANTNNAGFQFPSSSGGTSGTMNGTNYTVYSYLFAKTR
jgi:uncharacterized protein (TIGR02598 family)